MAETKTAKQSEIGVGPQPKSQEKPQKRCRVERQMMHPADRHAAKQRPAQRVEDRDEPAVALAPIDPDQHLSTRLDRTDHLLQREFRVFEVMDDADREGDVETLGKRQLI